MTYKVVDADLGESGSAWDKPRLQALRSDLQILANFFGFWP